MLYPLVYMVDRITPRRIPHTASLAIVYVAILGLIVGVAVWIGSRLVSEARDFAQQLPYLLSQAPGLESIPVPDWLAPYKENVVSFIREQTTASAGRIVPLLQQAMGGLAGVLGGLGFVFIAPVLAFLFLKDAAEIRRYILSWIPADNREVSIAIMDDVHKLIGEYIRSMVIVSALTGVSYAIYFQIIGLRYALLIAASAAVFEFIPYLGPLAGTILVLLVAAFTGFPHIWWILIFFAIYRTIQDTVIQPNLLAAGTQLHPLVVFFGAFAGQSVGGLWGMFLSVPVLAALRIVLVRVYKHRSVSHSSEEQGSIA
ncbi:MAG: AI-2E family transporter [Bryobacteraceae bacterium]|nr:AI-2E family transporter [Bryobacteraceae bacterium]